MVNVSIIIVNYNSSLLTIDAVNSIFDKTRQIKFEIIIVDNCSSSYNIKLLNDYCFGNPSIKLILNDSNLGFGVANNIGSKYASGDVLFFLNPDTLLINDAISILYGHLQSNNKIGICGGQLYDDKGDVMHSYSMFLPGILADLDKGLCNFFTKSKLMLCRNDCYQVGYITGADLMIRKSLFNKISGFDNDFFMYYEESEMTFRIKKLKYIVMFFRDAKIIHLEGKTHDFNDDKLRIIFNGRKLYMQKTSCKFRSYLTHCNYLLLNYVNKLRYRFSGDIDNYLRIKNKLRIYKEIFSNSKQIYNEE